MDGVVIYVSANRSRAIVWCSDQGALGLVRSEAMPQHPEAPLTVGDFVTFDIVEEGEVRLCGSVARMPGHFLPVLPQLLKSNQVAETRRRHVGLVAQTGGERRFPMEQRCG